MTHTSLRLTLFVKVSYISLDSSYLSFINIRDRVQSQVPCSLSPKTFATAVLRLVLTASPLDSTIPNL